MKRSKFLDQVREIIRINQFSYSTEKTYIAWIYRFIIFHNKRHPDEMGGKEIADFLTHLAVERKVSASTQNQALNALVFLYKKVLKVSLDNFDFKRARIGKRLPVVLSRDETQRIFSNLQGEFHLMASILYGSGMRLTECLNPRVKDLDFDLHEISVRGGKGDNDRRTIFPSSLIPQLNNDICAVQKLLGHKDVRSTMVYTHVLNRNKYNVQSPLDAWNSQLLCRWVCDPEFDHNSS